jgi:hypothetical protein
MRVLIACEFSGVVREAFRAKGCEAFSCDILPADDHSDHHLRCDVRTVLSDNWDLMIAHPPCTHLAVSGAVWFKRKFQWQEEALEFVLTLWKAPIKRIAIENPIGILSTRFRKPAQIIQPWMFGDAESKATCLWLKKLPKLKPTRRISAIDTMPRVHMESNTPGRWKRRSITSRGIAAAMAEQWHMQ